MKIFLPTMDIADNEGFKRDIFGRSHLGQGIINVMNTVSDPLVLVVDGQWGSGKTIFLKMLCGELRKSKFPVIYLDAFEHDYAEDAFTALAGEIISLAKRESALKNPPVGKFVSKAVQAGKIILRSSLKVGLKVATIGVLEHEDLKEIAKDIGEEASELSDKYLGELLTKGREQKEALQSFREALSELPALLSEQTKTSEPSPIKPLVFIIDELDRCKPTFALEVLERMKHFFSVPNVHFLLGAHMDQLANAVTATYGAGIESKKYLQKFVHLTFMLVDNPVFDHEKTTSRFFTYLKNAMEFDQKDSSVVEHGTELMRYVCEQKNIGLRSIERIMSVFALALASTNENVFRPAPILAGLCVLKIVEPNLYLKAKRGTLRFGDIESVFAFSGPDADASRAVRSFYVDWWRFCTDPSTEANIIRELGPSLLRYNIDTRFQVVPFVANSIIDRFKLS